MKVYCCQMDIAWEDRPANSRKLRQMLDGVAIEAGSLVLLPEMFSSGFSMNVSRTHDADGADQRFVRELAREKSASVVGGLTMPAPEGKGLNVAVTYSPDGAELARYIKLHPFTPGKEAAHFLAGKDVVTFEIEGFVACPFICYDLRFPEIFRAGVRKGASLFIVIANWPSARVEHWVTLLRARAIENQAYVAAVNRCGSDPWLQYPGRSMIVDPQGKVLVDAAEAETVISADVDASVVSQWRREMNFLGDMRRGF